MTGRKIKIESGHIPAGVLYRMEIDRYVVNYGATSIGYFNDIEQAVKARRMLEALNPTTKKRDELRRLYAQLIVKQNAPMPNIRRNSRSVWLRLLGEIKSV